MMQKTLKKSKKENPEKIKSYIVTENGLGKFLKFTDIYFALHSLPTWEAVKMESPLIIFLEHFFKRLPIEAMKKFIGK